MALAIYLLIGIVVATLIGSVALLATRKGDEEEHDIEHLDHEIHSDDAI